MKTAYDAIIICSPYSVGKTTVTEHIFSFFDPYTFISSKSIALRQSYSEKNVQYLTEEILAAKNKQQLIIVNPHIIDLVELNKNMDFNMFKICLGAKKDTIEERLKKQGYSGDLFTQSILDSITQESVYENNKEEFHFFIDTDFISAKKIAGKITFQLIDQEVVSLSKFKPNYVPKIPVL